MAQRWGGPARPANPTPGLTVRAARRNRVYQGSLLLLVLGALGVSGCSGANSSRKLYLAPPPPRAAPADAPQQAYPQIDPVREPAGQREHRAAPRRMPWPRRTPLLPEQEQGEAVANGLPVRRSGSPVVSMGGNRPFYKGEAQPHSTQDLEDWDVLSPYLEGVASWYGPGFHGKLTANGEVYDQHGMTAAHPMLPLGTEVEVVNLENGRQISVRINDRGPYAKGRILDLSYQAAQQIGMVQKGTAPVRIRVREWPDTLDTVLGLRAYKQYVVQIAAFPDQELAEAVLEEHQAKFTALPFLLDQPTPTTGLWAIIAGPFEEEGDAWQAARDMQQEGVSSLVRRYRK